MEDSQESFLVYCSFTVLKLYSLWLPIKFSFIRKIYILSFLVLKNDYILCGCRFKFFL
jgi:hypothetical protein